MSISDTHVSRTDILLVRHIVVDNLQEPGGPLSNVFDNVLQRSLIEA